MIPDTIQEKTGSPAHQLDECRNLIRVLSYAIDTLCRECDGDERKIMHIREMIASLSTLNSIIAAMDIRHSCPGELPSDTQNAYVAVRSCELERFSAR
jgi:hypothetical protein